MAEFWEVAVFLSCDFTKLKVLLYIVCLRKYFFVINHLSKNCNVFLMYLLCSDADKI